MSKAVGSGEARQPAKHRSAARCRGRGKGSASASCLDGSRGHEIVEYMVELLSTCWLGILCNAVLSRTAAVMKDSSTVHMQPWAASVGLTANPGTRGAAIKQQRWRGDGHCTLARLSTSGTYLERRASSVERRGCRLEAVVGCNARVSMLAALVQPDACRLCLG